MTQGPGIHIFDKTLAETNNWLHDIGAELGDPEPQRAYHALRGTLFALRDRMPPATAMQLAAQLPTLVRGVFYDGYQLADKPVKMNREEFIDRVRLDMAQAGRSDAENAIHAVLHVLCQRMDKGQLEKVRQVMPEDVRELWAEAA